MSSVPQARFQEFLQDIEPSPTTKANCSEAHTDLRNFLKSDEEFGKYHSSDFLSGSYKRDTAIRPRRKGEVVDRPDIDIIVVTNHSIEDNPNDVINLLFRVLKKKYSNIRRQNRSIGIEYYKADMDVVPVIQSGSIYLIPDRSVKNWVPTNPDGHTKWTIDTNTAANGRFKPLVKLFKWYRRNHPTCSKKPKGIVCECMVAECMDYQETDYGELFVKTLENIVTKYGHYVDAKLVPNILDPAIAGNSLTDGIDYKSFSEFFYCLKKHAAKAREALSEDGTDKATDIFREIFGDGFPKSASKSSSSGLLSAAVVGSASFPDRPIKPNKPLGFANVDIR